MVTQNEKMLKVIGQLAALSHEEKSIIIYRVWLSGKFESKQQLADALQLSRQWVSKIISDRAKLEKKYKK